MGINEGATVIEQPASDNSSLQNQKPPLRQRLAGASHFWASHFFPWSVDKNEVKVQELRQAHFIPWVGIAALICSALTILFSWVVLKVIDNKIQVEKSYLKPASWLSVILSANSVLLNVALSEGVTTAWWFTAQRRNATLRDIHEAWAQGHSLSAVLLSGKRFNYVALATLFVASIPLNGLLLQNAISTYPSTYANMTTVHVSMSSDLAPGFTADLYGDTVGPYSDTFGIAISIASLLTEGSYPNLAVYNNSGGCGWDDSRGICTANVTGVGFVPECTEERLDYDLDPRNHVNQSFSAPIMSSNITWGPETPNSFNLTVLQKVDTDCVGRYYIRRCTFKAAKVLYPLQIFPIELAGATSKVVDMGMRSYLALNTNTTSKNDVFVEYLPETSEVGSSNTTFGGIVKYLSGVYGSNLEWGYNGTMWSITTQGDYASSAVLSSSATEGTPESLFSSRSLYSEDFCNNTYYDTWDSTDGKSMLEYLIANKIRTLMFYSSIMSMALSDSEDSTRFLEMSQTIPAIRTVAVLRYTILYRYWAGSLIVTLAIMLMITPTFWGFWRLRGIATLSPVETAGAFHAPIVQTDIELQDPKVRLKEIGSRPLHSSGRETVVVP